MVVVRLKTSADDHALTDLFEEMQAHYGVPCPPRKQVLSDLASVPPGVDILVAVAEGLVGFASICTIYPGPGLASGLFLKEIFVAARARGQGVGQLLMRAAAQVGLQRGHKRLDLTADASNGSLLAFYENLGGAMQREKRFYRFDAAALRTLAATDHKLAP